MRVFTRRQQRQTGYGRSSPSESERTERTRMQPARTPFGVRAFQNTTRRLYGMSNTPTTFTDPCLGDDAV